MVLLGKMKKKKSFHRLIDSKETVYLKISRIETRRIHLNRCVFVLFYEIYKEVRCNAKESRLTERLNNNTMTGEKLNKNLQTFLRHIDSIRDTLPMTILLLQPYKKKANDDLKMKTNFNFNESVLFNEILDGINLIYNYCETCSQSDSTETLENDLKRLFDIAGLDYSQIKKIPYYENPFISRNWEYHNIGLPNLFSNIIMKLFQLRVKTFETLVKMDPQNKELKIELEQYKKAFEEHYDNSYHVD